jgi:Fe-S-cluster-containing hydrogenase component 2/CRP-like cAMP-binding protein
MLLTVTLRHLQPGNILCEPGEYNERLLIVLMGGLEQFSALSKHKRVRIVSYAPGSFLGEMGVMADQSEPFGIAATHPSVIIEVPKASVKRLMQRSAAFDATMNELYRRRALWTQAQRPEVLGNLPPTMIEQLFDAAELLTLDPGQTVFATGATPASLYLVRNGFVKASRQLPDGERVLTYFREGDCFGLIPLLYGEAVQAFDATCATRTELVRIPSEALHTTIQRHPGSRDALSQGGAMEAERVARSPNLNPPTIERQSSIGTHAMPLSPEVLLQMGVAEGREVLVIDQTKCTYCQNCIAACERRHGNSRLQLRGLQVEHLLFPTACRHCEDPQCLLCSVNGIVRHPSGEIGIVEDNCIGCGACAERCPYGNISLHPAQPKKRGFFFDLWDLIRGPRERAQAQAELEPDVPKVAVKCDLCAEYSDYACVTACPTGAAFRTDPSAKLGAGEILGGRRASSSTLGGGG